MADEVYQPSTSLKERAFINSMEAYHAEYERSIADSEGFWAEKAEEFHWFKKWDTICSYNYDMDKGPISIKWFEGGKTNITYNCLDRHLENKGDQSAIIWEGNSPDEDATLTQEDVGEAIGIKVRHSDTPSRCGWEYGPLVHLLGLPSLVTPAAEAGASGRTGGERGQGQA